MKLFLKTKNVGFTGFSLNVMPTLDFSQEKAAQFFYPRKIRSNDFQRKNPSNISHSWCLKITEKVSLYIERSILIEQKLLVENWKMANLKNSNDTFLVIFKQRAVLRIYFL